MGDEGPRWLDEREQRAWRSLLDLQEALGRTLERQLQRETGLSTADYGVLVHLSEAPEQRLRHFELGQALQWEKSRLSHHLRRMVDRGLIERQSCPEDNRGGFVALTPAGRAAIAAAAPRHVAHVRQRFVDRLTPEQLDVLVAIHDAVVPHLDAEPAARPARRDQPVAGEASGSSR